jgi:hypothetical protein
MSSGSAQLRLPEFIGVGPARTGTTWLNEALLEVAGLPEGVKEEGPLRSRTIPLGDGGRDIALHVEDGHYD